MTTLTQSASPRTRWNELLKNPVSSLIIVVLYIVVALGVLFSLKRSDYMFYVYSTCAFPAFVLSPFLILSTGLRREIKALLIAFLLLILMPIVGIYDGGYLELAIQICIFAALALGLNIVVGFAGLLDLGYIAFFAVGAYVWAMFTSTSNTIFNVNGWLVPAEAFWLFIFVGVGAAALLGILLGLPVLRLRGDYLAIVTLGFGEMIRVLARNADQPFNLTNGSQGLINVTKAPLANQFIDMTRGVAQTFNFPIPNPEPVAQQLLFYFLAIGIIGIIILIAQRLDNSPIGRAWTAIREDEVAAIAMGVPLVRMKLLAFATGASFAGAIGVLYAAKQSFVSPESFSLAQSISILAMVIVGGLGGIKGVVLGAIVVTLLNLLALKNLSQLINALRQMETVIPIINFNIKDWPAQLEPAKYERLVFGLLLIIMMIFRPAGIMPEPRRQMEIKQAKGIKAPDEDDPASPERTSDPVVTSE
jgi:branched-chain amino acid transport system permease protein